MFLLTIVLVAAMHLSDACFEVDTGYLGRPRGSNGVGRVTGITTPFECQVACQNDESGECQFWTWNSPDWRSKQGTCFFKDSASGRVQGTRQAGRISGSAYCDCFAYDTTIGRGKGNGLGKVDDVPSPFACQMECQKVDACKNWIWNSQEHERNPNACYLKKGETEASVGRDLDMNRISGPKACGEIPM